MIVVLHIFFSYSDYANRDSLVSSLPTAVTHVRHSTYRHTITCALKVFRNKSYFFLLSETREKVRHTKHFYCHVNGIIDLVGYNSSAALLALSVLRQVCVCVCCT